MMKFKDLKAKIKNKSMNIDNKAFNKVVNLNNLTELNLSYLFS